MIPDHRDNPFIQSRRRTPDMQTRFWILLLLFLLAVPQLASAQQPAYLREMPFVSRVKNEISGTDPIETSALQSGAFEQFRKVIFDMAWLGRRDRNNLTPDEKSFVDIYAKASVQAWQPVATALAQDHPRMFKLQGYATDPRYQVELLDKFFSMAFRTLYEKANPDYAVWRKRLAKQNEVGSAARVDSKQTRSQREPTHDGTINFKGLYSAENGFFVNWLRFFEDGTVMSVTLPPGKDIEEVERSLREPPQNGAQAPPKATGLYYEGKFRIQGSQIYFLLTKPHGPGYDKTIRIEYKGTIGENSLELTWHSFSVDTGGNSIYDFVPFPAKKTSEHRQ
jgi:hypothetical protein